MYCNEILHKLHVSRFLVFNDSCFVLKISTVISRWSIRAIPFHVFCVCRWKDA
jgi:hypothetical protein